MAIFVTALFVVENSFANPTPVSLEGELSYGKVSRIVVTSSPVTEYGFTFKRYRIQTDFVFGNDPVEAAFATVRHLSSEEVVLILSSSLGPSTGTSELEADFVVDIEASKKLKVHVLEGDPLRPIMGLLGSY